MTEFVGQTQVRETEVREQRIPVFVSGLPGRMATLVAGQLAQNEHFDLSRYAMTSARHRRTVQQYGERRVYLVDYCPFDLQSGTIAVDFTTSQSAPVNVIHYTSLDIPFVMGTTVTEEDRREIEKMVRKSQICAVIAPNMDMEVVSRQMEIDEMVESCPFFFWGATFQIAESHQASKVGVSGTARAFQEQLERHGAVMSEEIISIRDPERQRKLGVPDKFLEGHGYHFVTVCDANGKIIHHFETKVHGRSSYVETALMDVEFLDEQRRADVRGRVFSQADVLRNLGRVA